MKENPSKAIPMYQTEFEKVFRYDVYTNLLERYWRGIRWRVVTATIGGSGYANVNFNGRTILMHRIIWTLVYGNIPEGLQVDHIDGDTTNNNISNLQLLSNQDNVAKSKAGIKPYFNKRRGTYGVWALVRFGEKRHSFFFKSFKILSEAQKLCDAYNALFGWNKPQYSARTGTPEKWYKYMNNFKSQYVN